MLLGDGQPPLMRPHSIAEDAGWWQPRTCLGARAAHHSHTIEWVSNYTLCAGSRFPVGPVVILKGARPRLLAALLESKSARCPGGGWLASHRPCLGALVTSLCRLKQSQQCSKICPLHVSPGCRGAPAGRCCCTSSFSKPGTKVWGWPAGLSHNMSQLDCGDSRTPWVCPRPAHHSYDRA